MRQKKQVKDLVSFRAQKGIFGKKTQLFGYNDGAEVCIGWTYTDMFESIVGYEFEREVNSQHDLLLVYEKMK